MAAAPPAAGATPGTPHTTTTTTTTTMVVHSITTYVEHYAALPDNLQGRERAVDRISSNCCIVCSPCLTPAPRPSWGWWNTRDPIAQSSCIGSHSSRATQLTWSDWDGKALGFGGDMMPGNHIELMVVPDDAFAVAPEHVVPTLGNMNHLLSGSPTVEVLGPFTAGDPDTEPLKCRKMVLVPAAYLLGGGGGIAKEVECGVLLNWIRAALTV